MNTQNWSKDSIQRLLDQNDRAVERAVVQIYRNQTQAEQANRCTRVQNGKGFTSMDAEFMTALAESCLNYGRLTDRQLVYARKKIRKYWGQLLTIIERRYGAQVKPKPCTAKQYLEASRGT